MTHLYQVRRSQDSGYKELDVTEQLNSNKMPRDRLIHFLLFLSVAKADRKSVV